MRAQEERIYLDFFHQVKGFDGHLNFKDMETIRQLYERLDEDPEKWERFLQAIPTMKDQWVAEHLSLSAIRTNYDRIRSAAWPVAAAKKSAGVARAFPAPSQEEIQDSERYHRDREEYKRWVLMIRAKRKELADLNWMPESVTPAFRDNQFYRPDNRVDGRPWKGRRSDSTLPDGVKKITL